MSKLKIGWASRDVSTTKPVDIPGQFYIRVSQGILDPITVTALVFDSGADIAIFLSGDFVGITPYLLTEVRGRVAETLPGVPVEKIVMNCTHAHTGASYYTNTSGMSTPAEVPHDGVEIADSNEYRTFLVAQIADAIEEAWHKRAPAGIAYGYGYATTSYSRRTVYFDDIAKRPEAVSRPGMMVNGHAAMYGNTNDPQFSHFEAGADPFINLLYTFTADGKLTGAVVNVPCPSQCSMHERRLTADYWNEVRNNIRKQHGDIFILPQCAAAGDLETIVLHYAKAHQRRLKLKGTTQRQEIADRITAAFTEVLEWARKDIRTDLPLVHVVETVELSRRFITDEEYADEVKQLEALRKSGFKQDGTPIEKLDHDSTLVARRRRSEHILARYEAQKTRPTFPMELHVIRLGNIAFASNCFELYMDYQHRIQARSPFEQTFIVQLCGTPAEYGGYLATERGAWGRGYSASLYCNLVSPQGGQELVDETVKTLQRIYSKE